MKESRSIWKGDFITASWHAKKTGGYSRTSIEAIDNANMIYAVLYNEGWTLNAICGVLGNMGAESGYNPWRWQSDKIGVSTGSPWTNKGYGLVQFTPGGKYINDSRAKAMPGYGPNFSDKVGNIADGNAQILFVDSYADYYPTRAYPMSFAEFKASTSDPGTLAKAWLYNYERPADPGATEADRAENGRYWFQVLSGEIPPDPPDPPGPNGHLEIWMYFKLKERR